MPEYRVPVSQLCVGVYIRLDQGWRNHPFFRNKFKIRHEKQIAALKRSGVETVICIPEKSACLPPSLQQVMAVGETDRAQQPEVGSETPAAPPALLDEKQKELREERERCEKNFDQTVDRVKDVLEKMDMPSEETVQEAGEVIEKTLRAFMSDEDVNFHLMNTKAECEDLYYHSLNVTVLALMLGRQCELDPETLQVLGMGALFHDIGMKRIPKKLLYKTEPLTPEEMGVIEIHPKMGGKMVRAIKSFPRDAREVILQHHEAVDGTGFPERLLGHQISFLSRIVAIVDAYDNHCNKANPEESLSPYQALAYMFSHQKRLFDDKLLGVFIHCLGVYPPGTVVRVSDDRVGMVVSNTPEHSLRPNILIYDPTVDKDQAPILNMTSHPELAITKSLPPKELPKEVYEYLDPRERIVYFLDTAGDIFPKEDKASEQKATG